MEFLNSNPLITSKPTVYLVNLTQKSFLSKKSKWLPKVHAWVQAHGGEPIIPFSGAFETKIFDMPEDEKAVYCKEVLPCCGASACIWGSMLSSVS